MDTQIFHEFGTNKILREFQLREASYEELANTGFLITSQWSIDVSQSDLVYAYLPVKFSFKDVLEY